MFQIRRIQHVTSPVRSFGMAACLLAAGCSGGENASTPVEGADDSGLVEVSDGATGNASGPDLDVVTPGGKGPKMSPEAP